MEGRKHSPMLCITRAAEAQAPLLLLADASKWAGMKYILWVSVLYLSICFIFG